MRRGLWNGALLGLVIAVGHWSVNAQQQHQHAQPQQQKQEAKGKPEAKAKDPNRKKPENQPGKVMNAEELAASHADHHEMGTFEGGGVLPDGWKHRFDLADMKLEHARFIAKGPSWHVTTGPPGIYYNPTMTASGAYSVKGTFTQLAKGEHREGYGPFIGGADLDGAGQRYTYFLLRQDGKYLIKQRVGANTKGVADWTAHAAIKPFGADGTMTNELTIDVRADTVRFLINGTEVATRPRAEVDADGIVGLRVNHQLDLNIEGFTVLPGSTH